MGRLKKADSAGKTVEAWWALLFAEGSLGQSVIRWGWPVIGAGVGTWVASATDWISSYGVAGWAATAMLGALGFVWTAVGIDHFRSRRADVAQGLPPSAPGYVPVNLTEDRLNALIDAQLTEFLATTLRGEFVTHAQSHAYDEKLLDLAEKTHSAQGSAQLAFDHGKAEIARVEARIAEIAKGCFDLEQKFNDWTRQHTNSQEMRFDWVAQALTAVGHWDWHMRNYPQLVTMGEDLDWIAKSEVTEADWEKWDKAERRWRSEIVRWLQFIGYYAPNAEAIINEVPDHLYYNADWAIDEAAFGKADRVKRFKEYVIALANLKEVKDYVNRSIKSAAFEGGGKKGRPDSPPSQA